LARQVGVRGTPTFFVVGYQPLQGALPTEAFRQLLTMVYADATKGGAGR
jgi:protein-disulfide isomerase